jgi:hypothetical protein
VRFSHIADIKGHRVYEASASRSEHDPDQRGQGPTLLLAGPSDDHRRQTSTDRLNAGLLTKEDALLLSGGQDWRLVLDQRSGGRGS